jgi:dipeptidase E
VRLYLSSFRLGTEPARLVELTGEAARVAVVANAIDTEPPETRRAKVAGEARALTELGLRPVEVDLRDYVGADDGRIVRDLARFDALWVRGGNAFVLRHALAASGADAAVVDLVTADRIVYAGYSAGPCVLGPSLQGLETVDDVDAVRRTYGVAPTWSGLGVLDVRVVPHTASPTHPESAGLDRLAARYARDGVPHLRLRDGEALVVDGDTRQIVGRPATVAELTGVREPRRP